ncbi:hypothetical protein [Thermogutta sp.]|uniref:hypothetical protein n=1 Tax=Thermogutta sp. TaxID=1962930 RepID=UPI0032208E00
MVTAEIATSKVKGIRDGEDCARTVFTIHGSTHHGRRVELQTSRILVGSSPQCTLRLVARGVAPYHCLIIRGRQKTVFRALSGYLLHNGKAVGSGVLISGDMLGIGPVTLRFNFDRNPNGGESPDSFPGHRISEEADRESHDFHLDTGCQHESRASAAPTVHNPGGEASRIGTHEVAESADRPMSASYVSQNGTGFAEVTTETVWNPCGYAEWYSCLPEPSDLTLVELEDSRAEEAVKLTAITTALDRLESLADRFAQSLSSLNLLEDRLVRLAEKSNELAEGRMELQSLARQSQSIGGRGVKEAGAAAPGRLGSASESTDAVQHRTVKEPQIDGEAGSDAAIVEELRCPTDLALTVHGKDLPRSSAGAGDGAPESFPANSIGQAEPPGCEGDTASLSVKLHAVCPSQDQDLVDEQTAGGPDSGENGMDISASGQVHQDGSISDQARLLVNKEPQGAPASSDESSCSLGSQSDSFDHDQAVREYMRELLSRLRVASGRGETGSADVEGTELLSQAATSPEKLPTKTRRPAPANSLSRSRGSRKRPVAPEKQVNFAAMRELANLASQAAIDRYARAKLHRAQRGKAAVVLTAVGAAAAIFALDWLWGIGPLGRIAFFVSIIVGLVYGIQYAILTGKLIVNPRGQLQLAERRIGREMRKLVPPGKPLLPDK